MSLATRQLLTRTADLCRARGSTDDLSAVLKREAINSGMQDEIFHLTWFDVPRGVIHIRVSKNGKDRFVPINQTAVQCWKDYDTPASTSSQVRKQKDV